MMSNGTNIFWEKHTDNKRSEFQALQNFIKRVPVSIAFFDLQGDLIFANAQFHEQLGLRFLDTDEHKLSRFFESQSTKTEDIISSTLARRKPFEEELKYQIPGKEPIWLKSSLFHDKDLITHKDILVMICKDITSTIKVLHKTKESESNLNSIYENTYEGIYRLNAEQEITFANKSFVNLFGIDPKSAKKIRELFFNKKQAGDFEEQLQKKGYLRNIRVKFKKKDETLFWGLLNADKSEIGGKEFFTGSVIDITKEVDKDEIIKKRNEELIRAKDHLDRLLYSASHDLKSPISGMQGLLNLLELEGSPNKEISKYVALLKDCVGNLSNVIEGINNYALNTRKKLQSEKIQLQSLVEDIHKKLDDLPDYENVDLLVVNETDNLPFYSDYERIIVALKNVIANAIRFYDSRESQPFVKVKLAYKHHKLIITVTDNGLGIPKAYTEKVFGMFFRANDKIPGTGLGLYITKETVIKLGGTVTLKSEHNKWTEVKISIPNDRKGILMIKKINFSKK